VASVPLATRGRRWHHGELGVLLAEEVVTSFFIRLASAGDAPCGQIAMTSGPMRTIAGG
jgi:hypothetical protein